MNLTASTHDRVLANPRAGGSLPHVFLGDHHGSDRLDVRGRRRTRWWIKEIVIATIRSNLASSRPSEDEYEARIGVTKFEAKFEEGVDCAGVT